MTISLKTKFFIISMIMMIGVIVMSVKSNLTLNQMDKNADTMDVVTVVLRTHMQGDMMHDAMYGDVARAVLSAQFNDKQGVEMSAKDFAENAQEFRTNLEKNLASSLPQAIKQEVVEVNNLVTEYQKVGNEVISVARQNPEAAYAMLPSYREVFEKLEVKQGTLSDDLEKWSAALKNDANAFTDSAEHIELILSFTVILLCIAIPAFSIISVFKPQQKIVTIMNALSSGNLSVNIPYTHRQDEIGEMASATSQFKQSLEKISALDAEQKQLHEQHEQEKKATLARLAEEFESKLRVVVDSVSSTAQKLTQSATFMTKAAESSSQKSISLDNETLETSRNVSTVAAAAEQLSASIDEISRQVIRATEITNQAVNESRQADTTVQSLADASMKIGDVVNLINEIAGQINLLALNATIESARAGEAGRGFAVVASEVKTLASQTAKATDEIRESINSIQDRTQDTVQRIQQVSKIISEINEISTAIAGAVEEQGAATQEIARSAQLASNSTQHITGNVKDVTQAMQETGNSAHMLLASSEDLSKQANSLESELAHMLSGLRRG